MLKSSVAAVSALVTSALRTALARHRSRLLISALAIVCAPAFGGSNGSASMRHDGRGASAMNAPGFTAWRGQGQGDGLVDLVERWYHWFEPIPLGVVPHGDPSGANCGIGQDGPVWFLSGSLGNTFANACTVPAGKAIFSPIYNVIDDYPCPDPKFGPVPGQSLEAFLQTDIAQYVDTLPYATATLDGAPLKVHRVKTPLFAFTAAASNAANDSCITGSPQLAVSDGYYVLIEPLPAGTHVLELRSGASAFGGATQTTITLTVVKRSG